MYTLACHVSKMHTLNRDDKKERRLSIECKDSHLCLIKPLWLQLWLESTYLYIQMSVICEWGHIVHSTGAPYNDVVQSQLQGGWCTYPTRRIIRKLGAPHDVKVLDTHILGVVSHAISLHFFCHGISCIMYTYAE